jgi:hypothetical protein
MELTPLQRILAFESEYVDISERGKDEYAYEMASWASGRALLETDVDDSSGEEESLRVYPVGINYCRRIISAVNGVVWGEWDDLSPARLFQPRFDVPNTKIKPKKEPGQDEQDGEKNPAPPLLEWGIRGLHDLSEMSEDMLAQLLFGEIDGNSIFSELMVGAISRGTASLYLPYDPVSGTFSASILPMSHTHYIWNDEGEVVEAIISKEKSLQEALAMHWTPSDAWRHQHPNVRADSNLVLTYWLHWTPVSFSAWIEDTPLYTMANPTMSIAGSFTPLPGFVPLFPLRLNRESDEWYGHADIEGVVDIVREINRVVADIGENINMTNTPLVWFLDCQPDGGTKTGGYLQRLGNHTVLMLHGSSDRAAVGSVERQAMPNDTAKYIDILVRFLEDTGYLPAPAMGRGATSSTSGVALQTEMRPLVDVARDHRRIFNTLARDVVSYVSAVASGISIYGQRNRVVGRVWDIGPVDVTTLRRRYYTGYHQTLMKDKIAERDGIINEVINYLEHPVGALRRLGREDPEGDWEKIKEFQEWKVATNTPPMLPGQIPGQAQEGKPGRPPPSAAKKANAAPQQASKSSSKA